MRYKKRILKNSVVSVAQTVSSAFILFFLYRYLLHRIGPEQLGIWALVLASTSVGRLSDMGFSGAALKFVARHLAYGEPKKAAEVVQTAALSIGLALAVLAAVAYPFILMALSWSLPNSSLPIAHSILPWAVSSLWLGMVAGIFQSALDGCQRMDIRNYILIFCNIVYLVLVLLLIPNYGLVGLAKAQLVQTLLMALITWYMLRKLLPQLPLLPWQWSKKEFKEMFAYAVNFQIGSIAGLLFEPVTKFLLAKFGGLTNTAYYEMANQVIAKTRAVLVSGLQTVVPIIAGMKDEEHNLRLEVYRKSYSVFFFITWPYYILLALAFPLISLLWIGKIEPTFILYGSILSIGWLLSNFGVPAYLFNLGTGHLVWNTWLHILTGILNLSLGFFLGSRFGAEGVLASVVISLVLPSWVLIYIVKRRLAINMFEIVPTEHRIFFLMMILSGFFGLILWNKFKFEIDGNLTSFVPLLYFMFCFFVLLGFHPYRKVVPQVYKAFTLKLKKLWGKN